MKKEILLKLLFLIIMLLSIFIAFKRPAVKKYNINVFNNLKSDVLVEDFNSNLNNNNWNIIDSGKNNELQYYNSKNVNIKNGFLEIEAKIEDSNGQKYTSGLINTKGKFEFLYGKIIFKAKPAIGKENLSTVSLVPTDDSLLPEIDIIKALGNNQIWTGMKYLDSNLKQQQKFSNYLSQNDFSIYEMDWEKESIRVYKDNKLIFETTTNIPDKKMYLIINLAEIGNGPMNINGSSLPSTFLLDYIIIIPEEMNAK